MNDNKEQTYIVSQAIRGIHGILQSLAKRHKAKDTTFFLQISKAFH